MNKVWNDNNGYNGYPVFLLISIHYVLWRQHLVFLSDTPRPLSFHLLWVELTLPQASRVGIWEAEHHATLVRVQSFWMAPALRSGNAFGGESLPAALKTKPSEKKAER